MLLIHCEINLIITLSDKCVLSNGTKTTIFTITKYSRRRKCKCNKVFHCWQSERNNFRFFTRNCESISNVSVVLISKVSECVFHNLFCFNTISI